MNIAIVDYKTGNLGSIKNMLRKVGASGLITSDTREIASADKLILPGVGTFAKGMESLRDLGLVSVLSDKVLEKQTPILGICLGMQLFGAGSEEGMAEGLNWLDADTVRFRFEDVARPPKLPHMGWNTIRAVAESPLLKNLPDDRRFYFVHSYHVCCRHASDEWCRTTYHGCEFTSAVRRGPIHGVQFHPEKSHVFGMQLIRNFVQDIRFESSSRNSVSAA